MGDVFISYSSKNSDWAKYVANTLSLNQVTYWIAPNCIPGGSNYTKEIPTAIKKCKIFLILISEDSMQSFWVRKELDTAINEKKLIIPILGQNVDLTADFAFLLSGIQHYQYTTKSDPTNQFLTRIKSEVAKVSQSSETAKQETIFCPKCGCQNIDYDYENYEEEIITRTAKLKKSAWMTSLPMCTALAILWYIKLVTNNIITDSNIADLKKALLIPGIVLSLVALIIITLQGLLPIIYRIKNIRKNYSIKKCSCCRCGHRFKVKLSINNHL